MADSEAKLSSSSPHPELLPAVSVDLNSEIEALHREASWERGKSAKRLTAFLNFRVSIMALKAGSSLGEHHNAGRVSIQTVSGHVRVVAGGKTFDLPPGKIVFLDREVRHDVQAIEESAFLVTVAFQEADLLSQRRG